MGRASVVLMSSAEGTCSLILVWTLRFAEGIVAVWRIVREVKDERLRIEVLDENRVWEVRETHERDCDAE